MTETVLCYGDSNTWGYHASQDSRFDWNLRYPGVLSRKLGCGYHVIENGLCGRTTCFENESEPFANGELEAEICAEVNAPIKIAVIMLGSNDCKELYRAQTKEIKEGVRRIGYCFERRGAQIVIVSPPVMRKLRESPFFHEFGENAESKSRRLKAAYQELAQEEKWEFLDADSVAEASGFDHIHLDERGHEQLAEAVHRIILKIQKFTYIEEEQYEQKD